MSEILPKLVQADVLPNSFFLLKFDNGEQRYLPTQYNDDYVNAFDGKKAENKGKRRVMAVHPGLAFIGNDLRIESDGTLVMNGKIRYSPKILWENSRKHVANFSNRDIEAKNWKRGLLYPIGFIGFFLLLWLIDLLR